jgi:hypothetical protein
MKEDFLHYIWKHKKFLTTNLETVQNEQLTIINVGQYLEQSGPDFFNAQIIIGEQKWAGNVEIHLKSSDWYVHHHQQDTAYDNVILHVVWQHDEVVFGKDNKEIPVLEIAPYVDKVLIKQYNQLFENKTWINCEKEIQSISKFVINHWLECLFFERLETKSIPIETLKNETQSDWESILFCKLAQNFGLNTNGATFFAMAKSIPFSIIRKEASEPQNLESLFFGHLNLLDSEKEDNYYKDLQFRYKYLLHKYQLEKPLLPELQFFKLRPDNFPTIRLSQLANLFSENHNLFNTIITKTSFSELLNIFQVETSEYWKTHYQFDKTSKGKTKKITKSFFELLVINTIVPIRFAYAKSQGEDINESLIYLLEDLAPEQNNIIEKFGSIGIKAQNAFQSQALLQLKKEYCTFKKCLQCSIGNQLLIQD